MQRRIKSRTFERTLFKLTFALVAFLFVEIAWLFGVFNITENLLRDIRFRTRGQEMPPENVLIIDFPYWRSDRRKEIAKVVRALGEGGAKAIVLDILLDEPWDDEGDMALSDAIRDTPGVILSMEIAGDEDEIIPLSVPLEIFSDYAWGVGFANLVTDNDDKVVREALIVEGEDGRYASIAALAAGLIDDIPQPRLITTAPGGALIGNRFIPTTSRGTVMINYFGIEDVYDPETGMSRVWTDELVLNLAELGMLTPEDSPFAGKAVIIGSSSEHTKDMHKTPYDVFKSQNSRSPGIIVQANILGNFLTNERRIPDFRHFQAWLALVFALALTSLFVDSSKRISGWVAGIAALSLMIAGMVIQFYSFPTVAVSLLAPISTVPVAFLGGLYYRFGEEKRNKELMRDLFGHYLSTGLAKAILADQDLIKMGGYEIRCTFLICDIDRFSTLSENLDPVDLVEFLNVFFTQMYDAVKVYGGWLNKYLGDGMLVVYGALVEDERHADNAVSTALEMRYRMDDMQESIKERFGFESFGVTIGIHTGYACVGNIGAPDRMEYTVIGDSVNVCDRVVRQAKLMNDDILITQDVVDSAHDTIPCEEVGTFSVKGRKTPVKLFRIL
ncbi:adenylate/guanylate cyclase domain-containing protein [bacterium]|nr:adenylate/guanylate cyclase domain-containing protein [bacterium]